MKKQQPENDWIYRNLPPLTNPVKLQQYLCCKSKQGGTYVWNNNFCSVAYQYSWRNDRAQYQMVINLLVVEMHTFN